MGWHAQVRVFELGNDTATELAAFRAQEWYQSVNLSPFLWFRVLPFLWFRVLPFLQVVCVVSFALFRFHGMMGDFVACGGGFEMKTHKKRFWKIAQRRDQYSGPLLNPRCGGGGSDRGTVRSGPLRVCTTTVAVPYYIICTH